MKKLMIAAAIVCAAAMSQAAGYKWQVNPNTEIYSWTGAPDWNDVAEGTSVYLAFVVDYTQAALVDDFNANKVNYDKFISGAETVMDDAGAPVKVTEVFGESYTANGNAYYVIFEGDKMFVSDLQPYAYDAQAATTITFADMTDFSDVDVTPIQNAADGFGTAGWYQTVPEPTSGLLLLLGVAGLALRRRRA